MIKDLLVYLDGHEEDAVRLAFADSLALAHEAHVIGLYCNIVPEMMLAGDPGIAAAQVVVDMQNAAIEAGHGIEKELEKKLHRLSANTELIRLDLYAGQAGEVISASARRADLFIASRPGAEQAMSQDLLEAVMFNSGRGCILVPPGYQPPDAIDTVLVAWRNTREAARALAESLPILRKARNVVVAVVEEGAPEEDKQMPGVNISRHLDRHEVNVELRQITGWDSTSAALLNEVEMSGAQLVVMGGYGHSRFRQWVLGGVTRDIMQAADVPILLAH